MLAVERLRAVVGLPPTMLAHKLGVVSNVPSCGVMPLYVSVSSTAHGLLSCRHTLFGRGSSGKQTEYFVRLFCCGEVDGKRQNE